MNALVALIAGAFVRGTVAMVVAMIGLALVDTVAPGIARLQGPVASLAFLGGMLWPVIAPVISKQMR